MKIYILETGIYNPSEHFFYIFSTKEKAIEFYKNKYNADVSEVGFEYKIFDNTNANIFESEIDSCKANYLYA